MKKTFLIFISALRRMRGLLIISACAGILLSGLFIIFNTITPTLVRPITLGYIDNDQSAVSADFEEYAGEHLNMTLLGGEENFLHSELVEKHISGIVEIPQGFESAILEGSTDEKLLVTFMDDYENRVFIQAYLETYTTSLVMLANTADRDVAVFEDLLISAEADTADFEIRELDSARLAANAHWQTMIIVLGFFLMICSLLAIGISLHLHDDRDNGTYQRIRVSNVMSGSYVVGICMAGLVSVIAMIAVFFGFVIFMGIGESVSLGPALVLSLLFGLVVIAFALVCGLCLASKNASMWVIIASSTILCLLGGAYFPISTAPDFMQQLAHISPMFWYIDALNSMAYGSGEWLYAAGILLLYAILCFLIAGIRFAGVSQTAR